MKPIFFILGLSVSLLICNKSLCQPGKPDSIKSIILNEQRFFRVVVPEGYDDNQSTKYDVLYVTDGEWNVEITSQIQTFLRQNDFMPQNIIVAVNHRNRDKDLTPTGGENPSVFGGADKFLSFLDKELIPYINKKYLTSGNNALFGHSLGGLFATYALLTNPQVFDTYIAADPSFWWDKRWLNKLAAEKLHGSAFDNKMLYITGRGDSQSEGMGIVAMDSVLRAVAPKALRWKIVDYPGETHNSVKFKSIYDGMRFMYEGFNSNVALHPQSGIILKDKPYKVWAFRDSDVYPARYTTDGTVPNNQSAPVQQEMIVTGPSTVTIKTFTARPSYDKIYKATFTEGEMMKAGKPKNLQPGGVKYFYYRGSWDSLPDFNKLKPVQTGIINQGWTFNQLPDKTNYALLIEGFIEVKDEGYHVFIFDSDDGAKLYVGNKLLINYDGLHGRGNDKSYMIPLQKGFHPLRIEYFQKEGGADLQLMWITPGNYEPRPVPLPVEVQYHK